MDDIRRRSEFDCITIQIQAIDKLYNEVKKKRLKGEILTSSSVETVEVKALWQYTGVPQHAVAQHCCQLWIQLLQEQGANFTYILNGLLNQVPTAKNLQGIVEAVGQLLTLQVILKDTAGEVYVCPYTIRSPPHPFITMVTNRPIESWPLLLEQVSSICSHVKTSVRRHALDLLAPFLKFILLDPKGSEQHASLRTGLKQALIDVTATTPDDQHRHRSTPDDQHRHRSTPDDQHRHRCFQFLLEVLQKLQIAEVQAVAESSLFCVQLLRLAGNSACDISDDLCRELGTIALSLCHRNQQCNLDYRTLVNGIVVLTKYKPEVLAVDVNLTILGQLMLVTYPPDNIPLLNIVKATLKSDHSLLPLSLGSVVMPTINILATPASVAIATSHKTLTSLAAEVILLVEAQIGREITEMEMDSHLSVCLTPDAYSAQTCVRLARGFTTDTQGLRAWLRNLHLHIASVKLVPRCITNLLVSVLVWTPDGDLTRLTIDRLADVAKYDPAQAPVLLPVFLYALSKKACPAVHLHLMQALPKLATHKFCVPAVLKTIESLSQSEHLRSLLIKLLTDLWAQQDRCFPHLLRAITEGGTSAGHMMTTLPADVVLAKANAIKEVCKLRPEQHGGDMLAPLSEMMSACTDERTAPAAALVLEGLYYVCQAEVIDIMSAWQVLENSFTKETRPVVVEKICDLMSLVPGLQVNTPEYEVFLVETIRRLWLYTRTDETRVVASAYQALSHFSADHFHISHLQYQVVQDFVTKAESLITEGKLEDETVDTVIPYVPGVCYIRLMQALGSNQELDGFESFLSSMVGREVENLPRGIYYTSLRQHGATANQGKSVASVPGLIQSQYEKTKVPGLRPGLAAALLFCYDPPVETGRDGRPRKHYALSHSKNYQQMFSTLLRDVPIQPSDWHRTLLMPQAWAALLFCYDPPVETGRDGRPRKHYALSHSKNYQQMFSTLLRDVPIQPSDWHRTLLMPQAWGSFTERMFSSMIQGRMAQIDLELSRDFIDEQEADDKKNAVWLWVRDTIMDVIKTATKGNPSVQGNAILSLAGLASACQRYVTGLDKEERGRADAVTEHMSHSHWLMMVIDSCMSVVDVKFKPKSSLLGLCQQRSSDDRLPASVLAQACGILALGQMVPMIMGSYIELMYDIIQFLVDRLPGKPKSADCPPMLHMFHGLGLGMVLSQLIKESFADMAASKGRLTQMEALDALETCCFSGSEVKTGAVLGLGLCLGALCRDGKTESWVHAASVRTRLLETLQETSTSDTSFQPMCFCVAVTTATGFLCNVLDRDLVDATVSTLTNMAKDNIECSGVTLSLGTLCYSLMEGGHPNVPSKALATDWLESVMNSNSPAMERVASLNGLMALAGSEKSLLPNEVSTGSFHGDVNMDTVIKSVSKVITSSDDAGIQGNAAWLLGNLYMSACSSGQTTTAVPSSYSYLPEKSALRAVTEFLTQAGRQGPEFVPSEQVNICLTSLQEEVTRALPPLNWTGVLSPLLKLPFGEKTKLLCIQLAIKLCATSTTASLLLSSWIVPPLYTTLPMCCQCLILSSSDQLSKSITPATLQIYFDKICVAVFTQDKGRALAQCLLKGLNSALLVADPPEAVVTLLHRSVTRIHGAMGHEEDCQLLAGLSKCLSHVPDSLLDELTAGDCTDTWTVLRGTYIRCYLVGHGLQPIALLNSCIDAAFNIKCDLDRVLYYLTLCFHAMVSGTDKPRVSALPRLQWLLEIMGHVRNIASGSYKLAADGHGLQKVISFAVNIISSAVCLWTDRVPAVEMGLNSDLMKLAKLPDDWSAVDHMTGKETPDWTVEHCMTMRPVDQLKCHIQSLDVEPWIQIRPKMLDWFLQLLDFPDTAVAKELKTILHDCAFALRQSSDYGKTSVWTRAVLLTRQSGDLGMRK